MRVFTTKRRQLRAAKRPHFDVGGHLGPGSWLYGVARAGAALGTEPATDSLRGALEQIDVDTTAELATDDLVSGRAGLVLNLLAVARYAPAVADRARALAEGIAAGIDRTVLRPARFPDDLWLHLEVPTGPTGVTLALGALRGTTAPTAPTAGEPPTRSATLPAGADAVQIESAADALCALGLLRVGIGDTSAVTDAVVSASHRPVGQLSTPALLTEWETALVARDVLGDDRCAERARTIAGELLARRRWSGSWFPDLRVDDRHHLSALFGLGFIAHAMVRLARPGGLASIRLLG